MAANLRRGNLPTETTMARFMYYIIKQLDVRGVDWTLVADNMDITNGHAARMRYARYKNQVEGVQPRPREPRSANSGTSKNARARPVKKQKLEQGKKEEDEGGVKKDPDASTGDKDGTRKIKTEGAEESMPQAKMTGGLGPGAGIKREFDDVDAEGEIDETVENHTALTWNASRSEKSPREKSSKTEMAVVVRMKREHVEVLEAGSEKRVSFSKSTPRPEAEGPAASINPTDSSTTATTKSISGTSSTKLRTTSPQTSPHTISPSIHIPVQEAISPTLTFNASTIPSMQHLQLSHQPASSQRLFSNDNGMAMQQTHTPANSLSSSGGQGFQYPVPSYHSYQGQSPATTSSAPYSLPPSPVGGGGYNADMNDYGGMAANQGMGAGGYDMGGRLHNGMIVNQGSFVGMLQDPSFASGGGQMYGGGSGYSGAGGWEGMYQ